jgi:predicted TIM-barrel fold metal-dependent hydrolase
MRVDVHTHIFPPEIVRDRERFFHGEPAFKLLYDSPKARLAGARDLLESMERNGIDFSVCLGFPWRSAELARLHNDYILDAAAGCPRIVPFCCVHPFDGEAVKEARRCLEGGARGLGELALYEPCHGQNALSRLREIAECCRSFHAVMLVHANEPVGHMYPGKAPAGMDFFYALARLAQGVPLILAHWGGGLCFYELLKREVTAVLGSVFYDTAASPLLYRPSIYRHAVDILGKERILLGSDYPLLAPKRYFDEMSEAGLEEDEMAAVAGRNADRLFGLSDEDSRILSL